MSVPSAKVEPMKKSRMTKQEKIFYREVFAQLQNGDFIEGEILRKWLHLQLNKTY